MKAGVSFHRVRDLNPSHKTRNVLEPSSAPSSPCLLSLSVMLTCAAAALLPGCASLLPGSTLRSSPWRASRQRPAVRHGSVLAIEADMKDYVRPSGAPEVRAVDGLSDLNKPVLLYLPGIELSGYTLHSQTQELGEDFALHYLTVGQVGADPNPNPP